MKVIYETYLRRHRNNGSNNNNNGSSSKNNGMNIEICHPNEFPKNGATENNGSDGLAGPNFRHIISVNCLVINKELGVGEFGVVQQGVWTNQEGRRIQVAIKCLSATERLENNRLEFLKEASIMHSISNEHIVTLYGVVLDPSIMLVTELAPLRSLLECLKEPTLISHFPLASLCLFAGQVADGMAYLESKRLIHRDLAARNILVFSKDKVKISDFGLSRALGVGKDYYQSNFNVNLKLPIAWCAPECINYLKFTSQSDVWAYGVTLWEMFSFGFQPWAALTGQQILEAIDKPNYQRLEQPECCPKEYYQLMLKCWTHEPHLRPKFSEIVSILPDCKPELLQAIRHSDGNNRGKECLPYKVGDIVTVIEKCSESDSLIEAGSQQQWKGVTNDRKTGSFNPSDFVAYLGQNLPSSNSGSSSASAATSTPSFMQQFLSGNPSSSSSGGSNHHHHHSNSHNSLASTITSTVIQSSKFIRGFLESKSHQNSHSSPHGSRKSRLRPEMISRPQEGKYHHLARSNGNTATNDCGSESKVKLPSSILRPISATFNKNGTNNVHKGVNNSFLNESHEYHEISDEDDEPLESPPFEVLDFGPSLMEEVFRELDHIKPDLNNETAESETALNECGINVKNEVRELNLKMTKEANNSKKKQSSMRPISEAEQNELDSAIAMAKDIASRTMLDDDLADLTKSDSPKTPNSPNKRKFSFKFPTHHHKSSPKSERRAFCEETESIGNIIESITPAAKEAYLSLVDKGVSNSTSTGKDPSEASSQLQQPPPPTAVLTKQPQIIGTFSQNLQPTPGSTSNLVNELDTNPLRMLRTAGISKVLRPKVRGNRSFSQPRLPTTAQTACLARVASSRQQLGSPPPVPNNEDQSPLPATATTTGLSQPNNALPLPPRDRSRPLIQLKTHQRRHPLVIPPELAGGVNGDCLNGHVPVLKQVSCPQVPAAFLNNNNSGSFHKANSNSIINISTNQNNELINNDCDKSAPLPPPKPNRTNLDESTESLENEIQKAFDNIKLTQFSESTNGELEVEPEASVNHTPKVIPLPASTSVFIANTPHTVVNGAPQPSSGPANSIAQSTELLMTNGIDHRSQPSASTATDNATTATTVKRTGDEVRVMQKVLSNEISLSEEECAQLLESTAWDIHKAIKCVRLRLQLNAHNINVERDWAQVLSKFNWNLRMASNYLIATQGVPGDTTEV